MRRGITHRIKKVFSEVDGVKVQKTQMQGISSEVLSFCLFFGGAYETTIHFWNKEGGRSFICSCLLGNVYWILWYSFMISSKVTDWRLLHKSSRILR